MSSAHPTTQKELTAAAVYRFIEHFDGCAQFREADHCWAILCTDNKWRPVPSMDFERFLNEWARGRFGKHLHCGQSSEFKQTIQTLMVGKPRLSEWRLSSAPCDELAEVYSFERTRKSHSLTSA